MKAEKISGCGWPKPPNQSLQQTAATILAPRESKALSAAAAAELFRSAVEGFSDGVPAGT